MQYTAEFVSAVLSSKFVQNLQHGFIEIDNSSFLHWDGCFASGLYSGALRRVSARSRGPLAFGSAVHSGLETFFRGEGQDAAIEAAYVTAAREKLDSIGDPKRNTRSMETLLRSYFLEYSRRNDLKFGLLIGQDGKPIVEQSFSVPLGDIYLDKMLGLPNVPSKISVVWTGKIDLPSSQDGALWAVDHKTTSVMGEKFVDDKERSSQMLGYTYALRWLSPTVFGNKPVVGVRINALAQRSVGFEFKVFPITYSDWQIAEWQSETIIALTNLVRRLDLFAQNGELAPTRSHCVTKYGKCSYFDVCSLLPVMRDRMLFNDAYYYVSNWSPLD